ncbi:MAG: DUF481 domain-containing protein [Polyangiaceae bacterium]|nr:DUF481 domain-containing protein [Polyangiaceae bacterium]
MRNLLAPDNSSDMVARIGPLLLILCVCFCPLTARAQTKSQDADSTTSVLAEKDSQESSEAKASAADDSSKVKPWQHDPKGPRDWIRLNTGEWLAGRFLRMERTVLYFSSDKFDIVQFDWVDIHTLHMTRDARVVLANDDVLIGLVELNSPTEMLVYEEAQRREVAPQDVVTILVNTPRELDHWTLKTTIGFNYRRGNTNTTDLSTFFQLARRDDFTRFGIQYSGAYGRASEETNTNKHLGQTRLDIILSSYTFLIPAFVSVRHDEFQNLSLRYALGSGAGLRPIDNQNFSFDFSAGVGYQQSRYISVQANQSDKDSGLLVQPQLHFDWDITSDLSLETTWYTGIVATDISNTYHHGTVDFSIDLMPRFYLNLGGVLDRQESPREGDDGETPDKNDLSIAFSLGLDLQ